MKKIALILIVIMVSTSLAQTNNEESRENNNYLQDFYSIQMLIELERVGDPEEDCDNNDDLKPDPDPRDGDENPIRVEEEGTGGDCNP